MGFAVKRVREFITSTWRRRGRQRVRAHSGEARDGKALVSAQSFVEDQVERDEDQRVTIISSLTGRDPTSTSWVISGVSPFIIRWNGEEGRRSWKGVDAIGSSGWTCSRLESRGET